MTPMTSLAGSPEQSIASAGSPHHSSERPERSRNAKAQARHRAKRKAYIEQLEQTVTKLQSVLALSPDQVAALPPPLVRIRELEHENECLQREIEELRRQVELKNAQLRPDLNRRSELPTPSDDRRFEREGKRRRMFVDQDSAYIESSSPHNHSPPPPLSLPQSSHHYAQSQSQPNMQQAYPRPNSSSFLAYGIAYPATPSASSATSSPPFSPSDYAPQHAQSHHRNASSSQQIISSYSHANGHYELVKLEEEPGYATHHSLSHTNGYSATLPPFPTNQTSMPHWQTYSAERT